MAITFNGEIYNYKELRDPLIKLGYIFKTNSDTEVLCALYLEYGKNFVSKLNGMFSFVIYDRKIKSLFIARDRLGQKPLYYYRDSNSIEFASQVKQLKIGNSFTINDRDVQPIFKYKYIPEPDTIHNEVKKFPSGCYGGGGIQSK